MISLIEVLNYRCLRYIKQKLNSFHVLVGPNASGKSTFLDVIAFMGDFVSQGPASAYESRTKNFRDLLWMNKGQNFEMAIEAFIPDELRNKISNPDFDTIRYEISIGIDDETKEIQIFSEKALLRNCSKFYSQIEQRSLFPELSKAPSTILSSKKMSSAKVKTILNKVRGRNDNFYSEVYKKPGGGWTPTIKYGPFKSSLGNLPGDEKDFPVSTWFRALLISGVQQFILNSLLIRKASPPGQSYTFKSDGSNVPWIIESLKRKDPKNFHNWIVHLQSALPDLESIETIEREDDKHCYLVLKYRGGLRVPSWMASDGTLRLLALTIPAYLKNLKGVYLIEEPENGIHPRAIESMLQSLSSVYDAQILLATHSPIILSIVPLEKVLCFAKNDNGETDIVLGSEHPKLRDWRGDPNLSILFTSGVLG